jgi:threonine synthase
MLECSLCARTFPADRPRWRCDCGGCLRLTGTPLFSFDALPERPRSVWRYREALGIADPGHIVSLGEGCTPLVEGRLEERSLRFKLDFLCPTGSFKDRGSAVMVSKLREWGLRAVVEDSSGNAGASVAAYCSRAGIAADVFVPASASAGKLAQIALHGARLHRVEGSREQTTEQAVEAAGRSFYASHNWSPFFAAGCKTLAYELAEDLGWRAPAWVVLPVGGGNLLAGLHAGFEELRRAGVLDRLPRIAAAQASACAPLYRAWREGLGDVPLIEKGETAAEGISVARPVRGRAMLAAVRASNGVVCTVEETEIWREHEVLAASGIYVEPTSAVAAAACRALIRSGALGPEGEVVVVLTGSGLKATDKILEHLGGAPGRSARGAPR